MWLHAQTNQQKNICYYIDEMHVHKKTCLYFGILIAINMDGTFVTLCCQKKFVKLKAAQDAILEQIQSMTQGRGREAACSASHLLLCRVDRVGIIWIIHIYKKKIQQRTTKGMNTSSPFPYQVGVLTFQQTLPPLRSPRSTTCPSPDPDG